MKKTSKKYISYLSVLVTVFAFIVFLITDYLITLIEPSLAGRIFVFFCASIVLGTMLTIGISIFNPILSDAMTTLKRMLRVENLSNPLISKLSSKAPGTYHHSLNVSTLAQKAAKAIGANGTLVRIAAYYHDIGKLDNPAWYAENQSGVQIPTDEDADSIRKNAEKIISHVENGVKIAKSYNIPEEIIDMISEHHGTTRALYFYGQAKEHGLKIKRTDFKYGGPVPQSKESAILMLADCVEATTRSMPNLTSEEIAGIVDKFVKERIEENQFKNCNFSDKELEAVKASLKENLRTIYHQRLEYKK